MATGLGADGAPSTEDRERNQDDLNCPMILFVEGEFDRCFVRGIWKKRELPAPPPSCVLIQKGGNYHNQVRAKLLDPLLVGTRKALGFIRDSDGYGQPDQLDSAFQSLCGLFTKMGWPVLGDVNQFVSTPEGHRAGTFIFPARRQQGMLETLIVKALKDKPISVCVEAYLDCLQKRGSVEIPTHHADKARVQALVAVHDQPLTPLRVLFEHEDLFCYEHPAYNGIAGFLEKLEANARQLGATAS